MFSGPSFKTTFATFGGFKCDGDECNTRTNKVTLVNMETKKTCVHSELPVLLKEAFVYDYADTLLVCSASTNDDDNGNLKCYEWDAEAKYWKDFSKPMPSDNGVDPKDAFISSARLPGKDF